MAEKKFKCAITHDYVDDVGITSSGFVYDYNAITEWFTKSNIDPMTGLPCDKIVLKTDGDYYSTYNTRWNISESYKYMYDCMKYFSDEIKLYCYYLDIQKSTYTTITATQNDRHRLRQSNTFTNLQTFYRSDLTNLSISGKNLNKVHFYDCDLSGTVFDGCSFLDTLFMNCNMSSIKFTRCRIGGYKTCFYKSIVDNISFSNCSFEYCHCDEVANYAFEIKKILKTRLFESRNPIDIGKYVI
jgi:hypothetical protein